MMASIAAALTLMVSALASAGSAVAIQTPPSATPPPTSPTSLTPPAAPLDQPTRPRTQAELEKDFRDLLNGAVLTGSFRMIGKGMGREEPALSEPIVERYVIEEVSKVLEDSWMIKARIQYGDKDVTVPVIVRVVWAGDTPIITLDQAAIPLIGSYSARVMVYRGFYSGAWFGAGYGGVMSGQITRLTEDDRKPAPNPTGSRLPATDATGSTPPAKAETEGIPPATSGTDGKPKGDAAPSPNRKSKP